MSKSSRNVINRFQLRNSLSCQKYSKSAKTFLSIKHRSNDPAQQKYYLGAKNHSHVSVLGAAEF